MAYTEKKIEVRGRRVTINQLGYFAGSSREITVQVPADLDTFITEMPESEIVSALQSAYIAGKSESPRSEGLDKLIEIVRGLMSVFQLTLGNSVTDEQLANTVLTQTLGGSESIKDKLDSYGFVHDVMAVSSQGKK